MGGRAQLALAALWLGHAAAAYRVPQHRRAAAGAHRRSRTRNLDPLLARRVARNDRCAIAHRSLRTRRWSVRSRAWPWPQRPRRSFICLAMTLPRAEEVTLNWRVVHLFAGLHRGNHDPAVRPVSGPARHAPAAWPARLRKPAALRSPRAIPCSGSSSACRSRSLSHCWWPRDCCCAAFRSSAASRPASIPATCSLCRSAAHGAKPRHENRSSQRIDRTLDGLRTMPGVLDAATTDMLPGSALKV